MATEGLEQAFATTRAVVAQVTPDQYDAVTPCASWDVRALINHIVGGSYFFGAAMAAGKAPDNAEAVDFTQGDVVAAYDDGIKLSLDAFGAPGALERMVVLPFGTFPGGAFLGLAMTDTLAHGWDLARAIGQDTDLAPELAAELLVGARASIAPEFRGPEPAPFGPEQEAGSGATNADRLAAFLGRRV
jgi:uncharacterized protein (TIGR03086 family)